jgi:hypothetical protein
VLVVLVEMQVTAVLGVVEDLARFGEDARGERVAALDGAFRRDEVELVPVLPRLQRFTADLGGEADAEALLQMKPRDEDTRPARKVGPVFPERPVRRVVMLTDLNLVDRPVPPIGRRVVPLNSARPRGIPSP